MVPKECLISAMFDDGQEESICFWKVRRGHHETDRDGGEKKHGGKWPISATFDVGREKHQVGLPKVGGRANLYCTLL